MRITFAQYGEELASSRLRAKIPQQVLRERGIKEGKDVLIYGKHFLSLRHVEPFKRRIFDVCDDHYRNHNLREYYLSHTVKADAVTCNSEVMKQRIKEETGRDATVIPEPYESEEMTPTIGPFLLWYGHGSNVRDLERIEHKLKHPLLALSNLDHMPQWTPKRFKEAISKPCIVIIPTGKSKAKSENRMVEAIRCGKYVCAEPLPSYEPFDQFYPLGDIPTHIESALTNPAISLDRIRTAQDYIRDRYSPQTIADQWLKVIHEHC